MTARAMVARRHEGAYCEHARRGRGRTGEAGARIKIEAGRGGVVAKLGDEAGIVALLCRHPHQ